MPVSLSTSGVGVAIGRTGYEKRPTKDYRQAVACIDCETIITITQWTGQEIHVTAVEGHPGRRLSRKTEVDRLDRRVRHAVKIVGIVDGCQ